MASKDSSNPLVAIVSFSVSAVIALTIIFYITSGGAANAEGFADAIIKYFEFLISLAQRLAELLRNNLPQG